MEKKLSKYGNSLALIIDKPILELLNIQENTTLKISTDGQTITITPIQSQNHKIVSKDKKIQDSFEKVIATYSPALEKLAKN
jgi:antitoxin component of MazEF toxin-antitoxin module